MLSCEVSPLLLILKWRDSLYEDQLVLLKSDSLTGPLPCEGIGEVLGLAGSLGGLLGVPILAEEDQREAVYYVQRYEDQGFCLAVHAPDYIKTAIDYILHILRFHSALWRSLKYALS